MFKLAVLGPIVTRGIGVAQECIKCRAYAGDHARVCSGFAAGCLGPAPSEPAPSQTDTAFATAPIFRVK
jgi:hypothetical protein